MKYEYEFVRIDVKVPIFGFSTARPLEDYKSIIRERAEEGWRLVQIFAPPRTGHGHPKFYELILEREKSPNYQQ